MITIYGWSTSLLLASTDASWITGAILPVDGGLLVANLGMLRALGFDPD